MLSAISGVFGRHDVSIQSMQQDGQGEDARLIFVTHLALEADALGHDPGRARARPRSSGSGRFSVWWAGKSDSVTSVPHWRGLINAYRDRLPVTDRTPVVTLNEGNTPLLDAPRLSEQVGARVLLKVEGANPTGSFKDRGMTVAISKAAEEGAKVVVCASTGNTSASAAAYARAQA